MQHFYFYKMLQILTGLGGSLKEILIRCRKSIIIWCYFHYYLQEIAKDLLEQADHFYTWGSCPPQISDDARSLSKPDLNKNVIQSFLVVPSSSRLTLSGKTKSSNISAQKIFLQLGKKSKSVLVFLTFSKETRFLFSYAKVEALN